MILIDQCQGKNDSELVKLTLCHQDYFLCLMEKYKQPLLRYIQRLTNLPNEETQDILQDVFIKVYQNLNNFDQDLKFSSWIYRIAHNQVISHWRRLKSRPENYLIQSDENFISQIISDLDVEKEINAKLNQQVICQILSQLDLKYREVLILKYLEDQSYQEISDIFKKPVGTIGTLLNRAKKKFLEELEKSNIKL